MLKKEVVVSVSFLQLRICVQFFEVSWLHPKQLVKKFTPQQRNIHVAWRVSTSGRTLLSIADRGQAFFLPSVGLNKLFLQRTNTHFSFVVRSNQLEICTPCC